MLTLDQTTSLYRSLMDTSDKKSKLSGLNNSWATGNSAPAGRPRSDTFGIPTMPVVTGVLGPSRRSTSTSVLSNCVAITSTGPDVAIAKLSDSDSEDSEHGIPDEDETQGPERDAAAASPLKGKRRITSLVSAHHARSLCITDNLNHIRHSSKSKTRPLCFIRKHRRRRNFETKISPVGARTRIAGIKGLYLLSFGIPFIRWTLGTWKRMLLLMQCSKSGTKFTVRRSFIKSPPTTRSI
jgi:hypothetical protein